MQKRFPLLLLLISSACDPGPGNVALTSQVYTCGDDRIEGQEACDGADTGDLSCLDVEVPGRAGETYYRGLLQCLPDCTELDPSNCSGFCGDGVADDDAPEGAETCDGDDLRDVTCAHVESPGRGTFRSGLLACSTECGALDASGCSDYCGDGSCDGGAEDAEVCPEDCP